MATANDKKKVYKLSDCLGLDWEKVDAYPRETCDFCNEPIYYDGHWQSRTRRERGSNLAFIACKHCASAAGLEW
jgi:hypothetical protein